MGFLGRKSDIEEDFFHACPCIQHSYAFGDWITPTKRLNDLRAEAVIPPKDISTPQDENRLEAIFRDAILSLHSSHQCIHGLSRRIYDVYPNWQPAIQLVSGAG